MEVKIEKGIPVPKKQDRFHRAYAIYDQMEVGDSVLLTKAQRTQLHDAIRVIEGTSKKKLTTRRENGKFRVWKIGEINNETKSLTTRYCK
jgi:hypothetical protein